MNDFGIDAEPATDGSQAHVFVVLDDWALNGEQVQSQPLTIEAVDRLIDSLIDTQRRAKELLAVYGKEAS